MQVYRSSRLKGIAGAVLCAAFAYAGTFILADKPPLGWAVILLFGGMGVFSIIVLLTGGSELRVGRKGFELSSAFRRTRVRWDEIEAPRIAVLKKNRVIAINYLPATGKQSVSRALTGMDVAVGNGYNVPLQQLCETMNESRDRYLAQQAPERASIPQPLQASAPGRATRPVLLGFLGALLVLLLNVVLRMVLKLQGVSVTVGIAFCVGALALTWFLKVVKRPPTASERARFLWTYGLLVVGPYLALYAWGSAARGFSLSAFLVLALHALAYLAGPQMFLSDKRFKALDAAKG